MWLVLFRLLVVASLGWAGWHYNPFPGQEVLGLALGIAFALGIIGLELRLHRVPAHNMVGALVGGVTGLLGAHLVWGVIAGLQLEAEHFIHSVLIVFLIYMGIVIGARRGEWFEPARIIAAFKDASPAVRSRFAIVEGQAGGAQHRAGDTQVQSLLPGQFADPHGCALSRYWVFGDHALVFVDALREVRQHIADPIAETGRHVLPDASRDGCRRWSFARR